jgi:hypothetical protein
MHDKNRIHLVPQHEARLAGPAKLTEIRRTISITEAPNLDPKDIVRETLAIAGECREVLSFRSTQSQLLVDLVASLAVARLKKRGHR